MFRGYFKMTCSLDVLALDAFKEGSFSVFFATLMGRHVVAAVVISL